MAERRMFSKSVIDSDAFIEMPLSSQALYFHLAMRADDDGFVHNPNRIRKDVGASEDDLKLLHAKRFILSFDSGIIVIKHWRLHNYIQKDRYKPTVFIKEMAQLTVCENRVYTECIHDGYTADTQGSLGKISINNTLSNAPACAKKPYGSFGNVMLTDEEYASLKAGMPDADRRIEIFSCKLKAKGYRYEDHYATILLWWVEEQRRQCTERGSSSFNVDEFFEAALRQTYGDDADRKGGDGRE